MMNKKFEVVVPIRKEVNNLEGLIKSLKYNDAYIQKVIFVTEEVSFSELTKYITKYSLGDSFEKYTIIDENQTTKIHKLKLASKLTDDECYVIVLDEDDILVDMKYINEIAVKSDGDLLLTPLNWTIDEFEHTRVFNPEIDHWYDHRYFPYFNNHNSIPNGILFKEVFEILKDYDFQKHEDVMRSLLYLRSSKKPLLVNDNDAVAVKYILNSSEDDHESAQFTPELVASSINCILELIYNIELNIIDQSKLKYAQFNALLRILRTAWALNDIGLINEKFMENALNILKRNEVDVSFDGIFHNEKLKKFHLRMVQGLDSKWWC